MGAFELTDMIGHDVNYAVTCSVFDAYYGDFRFQPSLIQKDLVDAGFLGGGKPAKVFILIKRVPKSLRLKSSLSYPLVM